MNRRVAACRERFLRRSKRLFLEPLEARLVLSAPGSGPDHLATDSIPPDASLTVVNVSTTDVADSDVADSTVFHRIETPEELHDYLLDQAVKQWQSTFGTEFQSYWPMWRHTMDVVPYVLDGANVAFGPAYASTNVQVAGVDEADRVKADGQFLYIARENRVLLIDARDPTQLQITGQISLQQPAGELFVSGDRLTIISNSYERLPLINWDGGPDGLLAADFIPRRVEPRVQVSVFDIADRASVQVLSSIELDGSLVQSRAVGSRIILVTQAGSALPAPEASCEPSAAAGENAREHGDLRVMPAIWPPDWFRDPGQICVYETEAEYVARVSPGLLEAVLPQVSVGDNAAGYLTAPEQIVVTGEFPSQLVSTTVVDVGGDAPEIKGSAGIMSSWASTVYATADNVYIATPRWLDAGGNLTTITAVSLGSETESVRVVAAGSVPGHLINQFALDEHVGVLRVATTSGWGREASNGVYMLEVQGEQLVVIGSVTDITPGETLFAARFLGDRGYLVTFERIDPLISLDLSDPAHPIIGGELEIPGFSQYLHPVAGGYLIGLGRDADPSTGRPLDPQLSLFDVQDLSKPLLLDREMVALGAHSWSPGFFDHHAIQFFDDAGILAVPFQSSDWFGRPVISEVVDGVVRLLNILPDGSVMDGRGEELARRLDDTNTTRPSHQSGLRIYRIDPGAANPIESLGVVAHERLVERTLRIGDVLFAVSHDAVTAHSLTDPATRWGELYLGRRVFDDVATAAFGGEPITIDVLANDRVPDSARIVDVSVPVQGGKVEISTDGRTVLYTPPPAPTPEDPSAAAAAREWLARPSGQDQFQYTVETNPGVTETATVHVRLSIRHDPSAVVELAKRDLAQRLSIEVDQISMRHVEPRVWKDSCLGVDLPDQACLQVMTPGFVVWLVAEGQTYEYHTDTTSTVILVPQKRPDRGGANPDRFQVRAGSESNPLDVLANDFVGKHFLVPPTITAVSTPEHGGEVSISDSGLLLNYTPAQGFVGIESFTYTVDGGSTATVTVHVIGDVPPPDPDPNDPPSTEPLLAMRLSVTDADGNEVTTVDVGDQFFIRVYVDDLRKSGEGVFAAYLDLPLNQQLIKVAGEVEFSPDYPNGKSATLNSVGFDELGAFAESVRPLGDGERLLVAIPVEAVATGHLSLIPNPADEMPMGASLLYGLNSRVSGGQLTMTGVEIDVVNGFHNELEPADTNGDGEISPADALQIINYLNTNGPGSLRMLREHDVRVAAASGESPRTRRQFDANGDGFCTHMDVLSVINRINTEMRWRDEARRNGAPLPLAPSGPTGDADGRLAAEGESDELGARSDDSELAAATVLAIAAGDAGDTGNENGDEFHGMLADLAARHQAQSATDALFSVLGQS